MKKQLVIIALLASSVSTATAQNSNCDICEKVLVQDFLQVNYSESISLHYLNTINSDNYRKKETQSILSGAFPIEGVPVGGSFDYTDFSEYRSRLFAQRSFNFTKDQSLSIIKTEFSSRTLSAFNECISGCKNSFG
jgi:hypothetical protein